MLDPRIGVFLVLPNNDHIHPRMFRPNIRRIGNTGPDIGIQPKRLSRGHIQALVPTALRGSNRRFEKHFRSAERVPGRRLNPRRVPPQINLLPNLDLLDIQSRPTPFQNRQGGLHNFRTNAVPASDGDRCVF